MPPSRSSKPRPSRTLRRTALLATTSLAALLAVSTVTALPQNGAHLDSAKRAAEPPWQLVDLSRPIVADPNFSTEGLGNDDLVSAAVAQAGQDEEDSNDDIGDENESSTSPAHGISVGNGHANVDDIHVGGGHASIGEDVYAGTDGVWIDRSVGERRHAPGGEGGAAQQGEQASKGPQRVWTWEAGGLGCPGVADSHVKICTGTMSPSASSKAAPEASRAVATGSSASPSRQDINAGPTPTPIRRGEQQLERRQFDPDSATASYAQASLFPQFTTYVTMTRATSSYVYFGPNSNLNITAYPPARSRAVTDSGNGEAPTNINNPDSPDLGWLDTIVGAVPYKNGDLAASVVWILATICLIPLLLIRLLRRSSLISSVLFTIIVFMVLMMVGFGMRAKLADRTPTTSLMMAMSIILAVLLPLLLEPLIALLGLYSTQSGRPSGVPTAAAVLRVLNFVVFILFLVAAAYDAAWLKDWDNALRNRWTAQDLPDIQPPSVARIAPVVASIMELILILGTALLIPVARGDSGSMRPGGFIFLLLVLLFISCVYRTLQTLHATSRLSEENGGSGSSSDLLPFFSGGSSSSTTDDERVANGLSLAPQGMYGPMSDGIAWEQLQLTMASRGTPQTPVIFNLVYIFPMWLMVFLLFFAHAPGNKKGEDDNGGGGDGATATATATA